MVYTHDLKLCLARDEGSSPSSGTMHIEFESRLENPPEHAVVTNIIDKVSKYKSKGMDVRTMSLPFLFSILTEEEKEYVDQILRLKPKSSSGAEFFGMNNMPDELVHVEGSVDNQVLPREVNEAFQKMNRQMVSELQKNLVVCSGYRSPAYQIVVFLWNLRNKKFNLEEVLQSVALPGYSEHGHPDRQAIDLMVEGGSAMPTSQSDFHLTPEYKWLTKNAASFGFYESYTKDNELGVIYEPWHWHYEAPDSKK